VVTERTSAPDDGTCTRSWISTPCLNEHRPHGARSLRLPGADEITPAVITDLATLEPRRRKVLGGLITEHEQAA
jgi:hypothetical protein